MCRLSPFALAALLGALPVMAGGARMDDGQWLAGAYTYSDELGGFRILSASGTGTRADPVVLVEDFWSTGPVTLVIRAARPIQPFALGGAYANGFITLDVEVRNTSGLGWIGFEFELQEIRGVASIYGDGLSFDQRRKETDAVSSEAFRHFALEFEPGDRLLFEDGALDSGQRGSFRFLITDFTPVPVFYLVQDPRIPFS